MPNRHLQHIKSSQLNNAPEASDLLYGEIAVNYAKGSETLFIKNSNNEIVPFTNGNVLKDKEMVIAQALSQLDRRVTTNANVIEENEHVTAQALSVLNSKVDAIDTENMKEVTYAELYAMRHGGELIPGMNYRITDYVTTTAEKNTRSAGHQFDLVVMALDENTLSEHATALPHEGDTYFEQCAITAWDIKYTLSNNTDDFAWADATNGKGVIYYMKDEYGNECSYDFKNIQFRKFKVTAVDSQNFIDDSDSSVANSIIYTNSHPFYVGSSDTQYDGDVASTVLTPYNTTLGDYDFFYTFNGIKITNYDDYKLLVDANTSGMTEQEIEDLQAEIANFVFEYENYDLTSKFMYFESNIKSDKKIYREIVYDNSICMTPTLYYGDTQQKMRLPGNVFYGKPNALSDGTWVNTPTRIASNVISGDCMNNIFIGNAIGNTLEEMSHSNVIGMDGFYNKFGSLCYNNIIADNSIENVISSRSYTINIGANCQNNTIGYGYDILLYGNSYSNKIGDGCFTVRICGNKNSVGDRSYQVYVYGSKNVLGYEVNESIIGDYTNSQECVSCTVSNWSNGIYLRSSSGIMVDNNTHRISLPNGSANVHILSGSYGSSNQNPLIVTQDLSSIYPKCIGKNTNGDVVIWNPADHVIPSSATIVNPVITP